MTTKAITTYAEPCWTLVRPDSANVSEFEPHFDTEEQALEAVQRYTDAGVAPTPRRLGGLCSIATAACGYVYDEDGEGQEHWTSAEELHAHLLTVDWRDLPDGSMRCPAEPGDCDECDMVENAVPAVAASRGTANSAPNASDAP
jgi:hypothetical protein